MAVILDIRATKDEVLELYLNDVYLGNRGSFAIHGVAEAARLYFGKDVNNLSLGEAATIAGIIQSPGTLSPFNSPGTRARAPERRAACDGRRRLHCPRMRPSARRRSRSLRSRARSTRRRPISSTSSGRRSPSSSRPSRRPPMPFDVYTTLDLHLQRLAQDAVSNGIAKVDQLLSRRQRRGRVPQAALIAVDPRNGRHPRDGRRAVVQPVAIQSRGQRESPAGVGLQAVRVSRGVRDAPPRTARRCRRRRS